MPTRKKYIVSIALLVFLLATTTVTPAFMEKPDPLGGGPWPAPVCFLICNIGVGCDYGQWNLNKDRTFTDNLARSGTWSLSGGVLSIEYGVAGQTYNGDVTGRAVVGYNTGGGTFVGVHSPGGCDGVSPAPEFGVPAPDGSQ